MVEIFLQRFVIVCEIFMIKVIIFLKNISRYAPVKQGEFLWSNEYNCHIWGGRELEIEEFNREVDRIMEQENYYIRPSVRIIEKQVKKKQQKLELE